MVGSPNVLFDRRAVRQHRARAARLGTAEFLFEEIADRLAERLGEIVGRTFAATLVLGARHELAARVLAPLPAERLVAIDMAPGFLRPGHGWPVAAEPDFLPLAAGSIDLAVVLPVLHWVDDLPGALLQLRHALKPDGFLLGAMFGGETLGELRDALAAGEEAEEGGISPRVSPLTGLRDLGQLLQRAGFALPVVDSETFTATYPDAFSLMRDLRAMGETNALAQRRRTFTRRRTLARAAMLYAERPGRADDRIAASFEVLYFVGWAPHPAQPQPLRPGSATLRLADALGAMEQKSE